MTEAVHSDRRFATHIRGARLPRVAGSPWSVNVSHCSLVSKEPVYWAKTVQRGGAAPPAPRETA